MTVAGNLWERVFSLIKERRAKLGLLSSKLEGGSPLKKIASGYAYAADSSGKRVKSVKQLKKGDDISLTFADGKADARISNVIQTD